ncbi:hypothetical protein HPB49_022160 [Dermacentor silvarum]|uniref:Uncharacterized protein n=1 Tax=Dermacentor silvarum TaxID=543639 RepID=A0ACB8E334_DERSI|nr:hypothetical protein HPB49_022160 [Dermacentor silvarum]
MERVKPRCDDKEDNEEEEHVLRWQHTYAATVRAPLTAHSEVLVAKLQEPWFCTREDAASKAEMPFVPNLAFWQPTPCEEKYKPASPHCLLKTKRDILDIYAQPVLTSLHSLRWWLLPVPAQASYGLPGRAPTRKAHDHHRRTTLVRPEPERRRHALHEPTGDVARTGLEVVGAQHMGGAQSRPVADDRETFPQSALARGRPEGPDAYNDFLLHEMLRATVCDEVEACLGAYSSLELRKVVV